jgi:hypothetical protein
VVVAEEITEEREERGSDEPSAVDVAMSIDDDV